MGTIKIRCIQVKASLTVEASLVFPLFLFAVMSICCIFRYLNTEYVMEKCMYSVVGKLGPYPEIVSAATEKKDDITGKILGGLSEKRIFPDSMSFSQMAESAADGVVIKGLLAKEVEKYPFAESAIKGGVSGINCFGSVLFSEDETVVVRCAYKLKTPISMFGLFSIPMEQEIEYRYFTGFPDESMLTEAEDEDEEDGDIIVYITEEKVVYHTVTTCPSLNLVIRDCRFDEVGSKRNQGGGKYYPCEKCARGKAPEIVYIAKEGDRYHYRRNCSGLKRTITEIPLKEAKKTRRACKRCGHKLRED